MLIARLLRRSMRQSRILRLRNLALTPLDIAVRLDRRLELTGNMNITFTVNIYSIRFAGQVLRRNARVVFFMLNRREIRP
jgi:hypothetical protein